jgi:uncharacterized protein YndB with AHSA1/START domain
MNIDRTGSAKVTLPSDTEILITREFDAPAELIFEVWTTPEHVRNWWGWETDPMRVCEIDLQVGGKWRYAAHNDDYGDVDFYGEYLEIERPHRLVTTEIFAPYPDSPAVTTLTLVEDGGLTRMTILVEYPSKEARDATIASGMESGLQHSLDRAEKIFTSLLETT